LLAIQLATFGGSDVEAFDPIVALEQAKHEMAHGTGPQAGEAEIRTVDGKEVRQGRRGSWAIGAERVRVVGEVKSRRRELTGR